MKSCLLHAFLLCALSTSLVAQTTVYWDTNGIWEGSSDSTTAPGTWDATTANWGVLVNTGFGGWQSGYSTTSAWTAGDHAVFSAGSNATGSYTVTVDGTLDVSSIQFAVGNVTLSGGEITSIDSIGIASGQSTTIGTVLSGTQSLTVSNAGSLSLTGANTFSGGLTVSGGNLTVTDITALGSGDLTLSSGATLNHSSSFEFNRTVNVDGGTLTTADHLWFGSLSGTGGTGSLTVTSGSTVSSANRINLGYYADDEGTINLSGSGSTVSAGEAVRAGVFGTGTVTISDGATLTPTQLKIAENADSTGTVNLNAGGTLEVGGTDGILIGAGTAHVNLGGGTVKVVGSDLTTSVDATLVDATNSAVDTNGFNATLAGNLTGTGAITKSGTGILTLSGENNYSGGTTVSAGTLTGTTTSLQGDITNDATVAFDQAATGTYAGVISGSGSLTKSGSGNVTLSGTNSYSGATSLLGGILSIDADSRLGTVPASTTAGHLTLNGGTLATTADFELAANRGLTIGASGGTLDVAAGTTLTYSKAIIGDFTKSGAGTLTLTHFDSIDYNIHIAEGTLDWTTIALASYYFPVHGVISGAGNLIIDSEEGNGKWIHGANTFTGTTTVSGAGFLDVLADSAFGTAPETATSGHLIFDGGTLRSDATFTLNSNRGILLESSGGTLVTKSGNNITIGGIITGTGALTKLGGAALTLGGANTFSGDTLFSEGALILAHADALQNSTLNITTGGGLSFDGITAANFGGLSGSSNLVLTNESSDPVALTVGGNHADTTYTGILSGAGSLTKTGTGSLTLTGANNYSGGTTVSGGSLSVANVGSGDITVSGGGTLSADELQIAGPRTLTITGTDSELTAHILWLNRGGGGDLQTLDITDGGSATIESTFSLADENIDSTGHLNVTGTGSSLGANGNIYVGYTGTGVATVADGGTISTGAVLSANPLSTFNLNDGGTLQVGGTAGIAFAPGSAFNLNGGTLRVTGSDLTSTAPMALGDATTSTVDTNTFDATLSGVLSGSGALTKSGTGTLTLTAANTHTGATTAAAGTLVLGRSDTLQNSTLTLGGGTVDFGSLNSITLGGLAGSDDLVLTNDADAALGLTVGSNNTSSAYSGNLSGTGSLIKTGSGNLTLTGVNIHTGGTTVSAGILTGTTTSLQDDIANNAVVTFDQSIDGVYASAISGSGSLTKTGAGTLILTGNNIFSGGTTVSAGTLQIGDGGTTGSLGSGDVINHATLDFNRSDTQVQAGAITGTGNLIHSGPGTLSLTRLNDYTGTTTVNSGTLDITATSAIYGGAINATNAAKISVADNARLVLGIGGESAFSATDVSTIATHATLTSGAGLALDTSFATGGTATLNDLGTGTANLQKVGTGELYLTGNSSGTGTMGVETGTLTYESTGSFLGGTVNATNAAKISVAGGATLSVGVGGTSSFTTSDIATVTQNTTFASGSRFGLDTTGAISGAATLNDLNIGSIGFIKTGPGSLTLTGTTTNTGSTTLTGGSLIIGSDALLGAAPDTSTTGHLTLDGGTLNTTATFSLDANRGVALGSSGGTLEVGDATTLSVTGTLSGSGPLIKTGTGTLNLSGNELHTGNTTISAGTLQFSQDADITYSGTISGGGDFTKTGSGSLTVSSLTTTGSISVTGGNLINNTSISDRVATITGEGATFTQANFASVIGSSANGSLSITDGGTYAASGTFLVIGSDSGAEGTVTVNGEGSTLTASTRLFTGYNGTGVLNLEDGATATFNSTNEPRLGASATGHGTVNLSGSGSALTTGGRLVVGDAGTGIVNVGTGATLTADRLQLAQDTGSTGTLNLNAGGTLVVSDANGTAVESGLGTATFNLAGGTLKSNGTHGLTVTSNATLAADTTSTVDSNGQAGSFSGVLSGNGSLTKMGAGTLTLSGANAYTGGTTVAAGSLSGNTTSLQGDITNHATVVFDQSTSGTYSGTLSGAGTLTKTGTGTLYLNAANTYTGATTINAGTLRLGEALPFASTSITVNSGASLYVDADSGFTLGSTQTLGGTGSITGGLLTVGSGAHLAPGNSPGTLTFTEGLTLDAGAILNFELGTVSDLIAVTGGTLTGPSSGTVTLNLADSGGFTAGTYTLFEYTSATLSDFDTTDFALGTTIAGYDYSFNLTGSALQLVALTAVPEPSTYAAILGLGALGFVAWRKRRRR